MQRWLSEIKGMLTNPDPTGLWTLERINSCIPQSINSWELSMTEDKRLSSVGNNGSWHQDGALFYLGFDGYPATLFSGMFEDPDTVVGEISYSFSESCFKITRIE